MKAYFQVFLNYKHDNWAKPVLITEFVYNNTKNTGISYILFELNCVLNSQASYRENINFWSKSKATSKLASKLKELIAIYRQTFQHA